MAAEQAAKPRAASRGRATVGQTALAAPDQALDLALYDYPLPPSCIAQHPASERDGAKLLHLDRASGSRAHRRVLDLPALLEPGDLLVVNTTRVLPARLRGRKRTGGAAEALLLGEAASGRFRALVRARGRQRVGLGLVFEAGERRLEAEIVEILPDGAVTLAFAGETSPYALGETPLPPYIRRGAPEPADAARYQTVYAREPGSVAAPTAGLHLSERLLAALAERGIARAGVVLHVGPGTFRPLGAAELGARRLHPERFALPPATAAAIDAARARGGRVVAVGTTTTRVLEARANASGGVDPGEGETDLFLLPGSRFRVVDALLTNFHLPRSSLLLLAAAFAGRERVLSAYAEAIREGYRFYSYGDAMLIT
jgi:S-adenosylmethionine:tRNA ribosyltransferase-isomerase